MQTPNKSFQILEDERRKSCVKINFNLWETTNNYLLDKPIDEITSPLAIVEIIEKKQGKPKWGDTTSTEGWKEFYEYAKLIEERYSVFPYTLFEPKRKNKYYIDNIIALREKGGASRIKRSKLESLDNYQIMELFQTETEMAVPLRRALKHCYPTELVGLSASSNEYEKALEQEIKQEEKKQPKPALELPPSVNAGQKNMTVDEMAEIMKDYF